MKNRLAILGGEKAVKANPKDIFDWPRVNKEMEEAVLDVLRKRSMSGTDITREFEKRFAQWHKMKYGLGCNTGTSALHCAFFGVGIGKGDEVISPSVTYWASCLPVFSLGATVVFADIEPDTLCIDPDDIEKRITERTKAILVVHYCARPADMDRIMKVAKKYNLKVIEDVSHAHGALYKGKMVGTFGDVSAFSCMSGKSFAIGEAGIMLTNDKEIYERAIAFGHYERHNELTIDYLKEGAGLPWGGYKYRMHQMSSAVGLVQLKKYPQEMVEIDRAMNYFWDKLEGLPGIRSPRPPKDSKTTMGGWYASLGHYRSEELGGLSITRFCEALRAEGVNIWPGCNKALHQHPVFNTIDIYKDGKPTRIANSPKDIRNIGGPLPVSDGIQKKVFVVPWFKRFYPEIIDEYAYAFKKVIENYKELLKDDPGDPPDMGRWMLSVKAVKG
ncbi:MAG: DegT/DnrJ/EryC1/StrS family aminotransferase [Candidatus Omnitrophica bacterium]|nr:DegT/DnrJ/EryC1/StrS family aminotransferase [Candidatus Omnitrophota bacterium]